MKDYQQQMENLKNLQKQFDNMVKDTAHEFKMTPQELDEYFSDRRNFSHEQWESLDSDRKKIENLRKELCSILGINFQRVNNVVERRYKSFKISTPFANTKKTVEKQDVSNMSFIQKRRHYYRTNKM